MKVQFKQNYFNAFQVDKITDDVEIPVWLHKHLQTNERRVQGGVWYVQTPFGIQELDCSSYYKLFECCPEAARGM